MLLDFCDIRIKNVHKFLVSLSYKHRLEKPNSIVKEKLEILNITLIFFTVLITNTQQTKTTSTAGIPETKRRIDKGTIYLLICHPIPHVPYKYTVSGYLSRTAYEIHE